MLEKMCHRVGFEASKASQHLQDSLSVSCSRHVQDMLRLCLHFIIMVSRNLSPIHCLVSYHGNREVTNREVGTRKWALTVTDC